VRVRRTGAKRGQSPVWFIQASTEAEVNAIRAGLLENKSPDPRWWRHVLAWGYSSKKAALAGMADLQHQVDTAIAELHAQEIA